MRRPSTPSERIDRRMGVLLLIVLVALIVLASAMARIAMRTSQIQRSRLRSLTSMQTRWGRLSCEAALLPQAEGAIAAASGAVSGRGPRSALPHQLVDWIKLDDQRFDIILADESAKANLNAIYDRDGRRAVEIAVQDLTGLAAATKMRLSPMRPSLAKRTAATARQSAGRLGGQRPTAAAELNLGDGRADENPPTSIDDEIDLSGPPALPSWGNIFDIQEMTALTGNTRSLAEISRHVTLFGGSRLNVWRASDETIVATIRGQVQVGLARRFVDRLRSTSVSEVGLVLQQTITNAAHRNELNRRLGNQSTDFSVWVESSGAAERRQWWTVRTVSDQTGDVATRTFTFP